MGNMARFWTSAKTCKWPNTQNNATPQIVHIKHKCFWQVFSSNIIFRRALSYTKSSNGNMAPCSLAMATAVGRFRFQLQTTATSLLPRCWLPDVYNSKLFVAWFLLALLGDSAVAFSKININKNPEMSLATKLIETCLIVVIIVRPSASVWIC